MKGICITIHHEGTFTYDPLSYECGDVEVVENVDLGNTSYERLLDICKECCLFPVHGMYFCAPKVDIAKHLKPLRNDSELANFVKLSYDNGCKVELYVEHHGYNVLDGVTEEVVDEELDDEIEMEDVSEFVGLDHVGEEDVELPNTGLNDTFLNMLVDGKFISDKDFGAKVDTQSSSLRNIDDSSVDNRFKVGQKGKQKVVKDIGTPKSKKGKSKKSKSPKTPKSPKTSITTPNADAAKKGCSFRLWAGWMQSESSFQIKTLVPTHTCSRNFNLGSLVTYKWIAKQFAVEVLKNPKISYRQMVADVREKFLINVSVHQCRRAKHRAIYDLEGGLIDHYAKLWDYRDEILSTNPGSTVQLDVDTLDDGKTLFKRMYICFKVATYSLLNQDPSKGVSSWYSKQMWVDAYSYFIKPVSGSSIWVKSANPPPLPPKKRIMPADPSSADPSSADPSSADPSAADPSSADLSAADSTFADPNQTFTGLLNCVEQQSMGVEITDAEIAALADMNEVKEREARRKDAERVFEEAKKKGVYRKRGAGGWRGPSERIANQRRKKEDPNGPGNKPDTPLDVSD
ncbi:hypothetical protein Tco_0374730 [Tanacetum coccineum]